MTTAKNNTTATPAQRAMACLHKTPNGGYSIRSGCGDEFEQIPFEHESDYFRERDIYVFDGGDGDYLTLYLEWGDDEFFMYI